MILTQVLCPERAQLFFIMATAFISLCHFRCAFILIPVCSRINLGSSQVQVRFKFGSTLLRSGSKPYLNGE